MTDRSALRIVEDADETPAWRQERRARIVSAAMELFGREPYAAVQMDDIARVAGVGKPTLYRYFPAKDALFLAASDHVLAELEAELTAALAVTRPAEETLADMIHLIMARFSTQLSALGLLGGEQPGLADRTRRLFGDRRHTLIGLLRQVLRRGRESGVFRDLDEDATAPMLIGVIRGGLLGAADLPVARMADAAVALVLRGTLKSL